MVQLRVDHLYCLEKQLNEVNNAFNSYTATMWLTHHEAVRHGTKTVWSTVEVLVHDTDCRMKHPRWNTYKHLYIHISIGLQKIGHISEFCIWTKTKPHWQTHLHIVNFIMPSFLLSDMTTPALMQRTTLHHTVSKPTDFPA